MPPDTYEVRYLELASKPGMESLRRECPCIGAIHFDGMVVFRALTLRMSGDNARSLMNRFRQDAPCQVCGPEYTHISPACLNCQGRNWLPLPEAERLGALVRVATVVNLWEGCYGPDIDTHYWYCCLEKNSGAYRGVTPEAALVEALLGALKNHE